MALRDAAAYESFVAGRRAAILEAVGEACREAGRDASEVLVEAVSKTVGLDEVRCAWDAGWRAFAENRPQELTRKLDAIREAGEMPGVRFDMIGNLQKNKINQVLGRAELVHSISSEHLAEAVSRRAAARGAVQPVLLEANVSGEASKSGFAPDELLEAGERIAALEGIEVHGLMTMAPAGDPDAARRTFCGLRELRDVLRARTGLGLPELSCGMSDDFREAVLEGSTIVRLGRVVFSPDYELAAS